MRSRIMFSAAVAAMLLAVPALASAHAPLTGSSPKAGESLDTAPTKVTLTFKSELDPDGSSFSVADADGTKIATGSVDLTVADRNVMAADLSISAPGVYTVDYVSKSIDGAVLTGTFSFGYQTDASIPAATGGDDDDDHGPDTALDAPSPLAPLAPIGVLLLLGAGTLLVRRVALR
jgi:methionine-rich copper-binding protein CopC